MGLRLPDLPAASQLIISDEIDFTTSLPDWELIIGADPNRWFISFSAGDVGKIWLCTKPLAGVFKGIGLDPGTLREIDFQRYGPIAGAAWYANGGGAGFPLTYYYSKWNVTEHTRPEKSE